MSSTSPINPTPQSPILIMGAGLGGLFLAQGLKKNKIPFRIFERDPTPTSRPQGYRIRINSDPLKEVLPDNVFTDFDQTCAITPLGFCGINAITGEKHQNEFRPAPAGPVPGNSPPPVERPAEPPRGNPSVSNKSPADRTTLRRVLMTGLEDHISFGKAFASYEVTPDGVIASFDDDSKASGCLIVGADGVRSHVRKQCLPDLRIIDTQCRCICGKTLVTPTLLEKVNPDAMKGMTTIREVKGDKGFKLVLFEEHMQFRKDVKGVPKDYIYWVLLSHMSIFPIATDKFMALTHDQAADLSIEMTKNWDPKVRCLVELQDRDLTSTIRVSSVESRIAAWKPSDRVVLLGDAFHPVSPTAGGGANLAFADAVELLKIICRGMTMEDVGVYEKETRERAGKTVMMSVGAATHIYGGLPFELCQLIDVWAN